MLTIKNVLNYPEREKAFAEKSLIKQSYLVKFDTCTPVTIVAEVNWTGDFSLPLTIEEIIEEAIGYGEDLKISLNKEDAYEIELIEFEMDTDYSSPKE